MSVGAVHDTEAWALPAVAMAPVGIPGTVPHETFPESSREPAALMNW